jgi:hypothetical protein
VHCINARQVINYGIAFRNRAAKYLHTSTSLKRATEGSPQKCVLVVN